MKIFIQLVLSVVLSLAAINIFAQQAGLSSGKAPFNKEKSHIQYGASPLATVAYLNDNSTSEDIVSGLDSVVFMVLGYFTAPNFAASMCRGGDGNYYLIDVAPALYLFGTDPGSTCTLIGNITGMNGDQPNGISYDPVNDTYYMVSSSALYSLDINTLTATLIGNFNPTISGIMIDLCFDENGTCYAYEVNITPGAANAYIIDINTAALTTLGYVGFTPNFGQGMSYDYETQTIYLAAYNYDLGEGELRTMDKTTGNTTLIYAWGDQIAPFAVETWYCCCNPYPGSATNPYPPYGATNVSVNGITLTWENGELADMVEVWFGPAENEVKVYDGSLITSWDTGPLEYFTTYKWHIVEKNDTCSNAGSHWNFTTEQNPNLVVGNFLPPDIPYATGYTDSITKYDGEINTEYPNVGWAVFDISYIQAGSTIQEADFYGYVNATNWPYWSATPMGMVNPVTDSAGTIYNQVLASYGQSIAYIYSDEASTFTTGWHNYLLGNSALPDLQAAVNTGQGWFAMGFVDRDFIPDYYLNFDGWMDVNPPYLEITYIPPTPVELSSFRANVKEGIVSLNWQTATETNNKGFSIERQVGSKQPAVSNSGWEEIGFVNGNGTSTETHNYSYIDKPSASGKYTYRLKQVDFDGSSEYSNEIEVEVEQPKIYLLEQNYPNPFNPTTEIRYSLAEDSKVTLKIFDILGREVTTLLNGNVTSGEHTIAFNASNLPSGVYIYEIKANGLKGSNFTSVKKMVFMK